MMLQRAAVLTLLGLGLAAAAFAGTGLSRLLDTSAIAAPDLLEPADGAVLNTPSPTFRWRTAGAAEIEFEAFADEHAAAISAIRQDEGSFTVPPPDQWCCLKPGVVYRWRVSATDSPLGLTHDDPYWGPWSAERTFTIQP